MTVTFVPDALVILGIVLILLGTLGPQAALVIAGVLCIGYAVLLAWRANR